MHNQTTFVLNYRNAGKRYDPSSDKLLRRPGSSHEEAERMGQDAGSYAHDMSSQASSARAAKDNLRQALSNLRAAIGDRALDEDQDVARPFLLISRQTVQFNPAGDYWLDMHAFDELLRTNTVQIRTTGKPTDCFSCRNHAQLRPFAALFPQKTGI